MLIKVLLNTLNMILISFTVQGREISSISLKFMKTRASERVKCLIKLGGQGGGETGRKESKMPFLGDLPEVELLKDPLIFSQEMGLFKYSCLNSELIGRAIMPVT